MFGLCECKLLGLNSAQHGYVYQVCFEDTACLTSVKLVFSTNDGIVHGPSLLEVARET